MTSPAITIAPYESVVAGRPDHVRAPGQQAARWSRTTSCVGIVTRADLVRAFTRTDAEVEHELREDVLARDDVDRRGYSGRCRVRNGVVNAALVELETRSDVELLNRLAARVPGVVAVESTVQWRVRRHDAQGQAALEQTVR